MDSLRPPGSRILFFDDFSGSQLAWNQLVIGGKHSFVTVPSFIRQTPLLAYQGSTGSMQVYAGTAVGAGNTLTGGFVTCDARRYIEYMPNTKLGCEVWYTWLAQMNQEEGLIGICLSQMDGTLDTRLQLRFDNVYGVTRTDFETSQQAVDQLSSTLTFNKLPSAGRSDGIQNAKWSHILLEADYTKTPPVVIRALKNHVDYTPIIAGNQLATQLTSLFNEAPKTGIEIFLYNQSGSVVRGAEYFIGAAILYQLPG